MHFFSKPKAFIAPFFILCWFRLFYKTVFCGMQKHKGKLIFWKIDIIHVFHIVSFLSLKLNLVDFGKRGSSVVRHLPLVLEVPSSIPARGEENFSV